MMMKKILIYSVAVLTAAILGCSKEATAPEPELTAAQLLSQGWTYFNAGSFSAALSSFQQAKAKDPALVDAYNGIGWCQGITGQNNEAQATFNSGLARQVANNEMRAGLSFVLASLDSCPAAVRNDSLVLASDSLWEFSHKYSLSADQIMNYKELNLLLAECYYKLGSFGAALDAVKKLDPLFTVTDVNTSEGQSELLMKIESLGSTI
ncbi:TPA: hypothetical protein DCG35_01435 [Candidatus Edwardsbacteria bacterium]|nr:hypothetical protein [Candidatus Edwardsbacteria bacterium]HBZ87123.1 hypothetical protein [Candidatus Edwardsbacteria bacterium]